MDGRHIPASFRRAFSKLEAEVDELLRCMCAAHAEETGRLATVHSVQIGGSGALALGDEHGQADGTHDPELVARWRRMTDLRPSEAALFWETFDEGQYRLSLYPRTARPYGTVSLAMSALEERTSSSTASVGTARTPGCADH